jgi:hypothetical protein
MVGREEVGFRSIASRCDGWKDGARRRGVGGAGPLSLRSVLSARKLRRKRIE